MDSFPDFQQLLQLAQSPVGQQLISILRQSGGNSLDEALASASSGDYTHVRQILTTLLSSPDAQHLLRQLEDQI